MVHELDFSWVKIVTIRKTAGWLSGYIGMRSVAKAP